VFEPDPLLGNGQPTGAISVGYPVNVFNGFPVSSLQFRSVAQDFRNPEVQEWNLAIQQELPGQMALEVGFLGNHQSHQLLQPDFNTCPLVFTTNSAITCQNLRPYPDIGSISGTATYGVGNYAALEASLQKRLTKGLQFQASYTYGHALSDTATTLSGSSGLGLPNPGDQQSEYSSASWDIRHNFTAAFNYDIPFGRGLQYGANLNKIVQTALGNWELNGILSLRTGQPYTLTANGCQEITGGCYPEIIAGSPNEAPSGGRNPSEWFNTANFAAPAPLTQGNTGLQTQTGPATRTLDFSVFKNFNFTETMAVQFRCEAINLANTPQFSLPGNTFGNSNFGIVTSSIAGTERHIQFQLRFQF
jgi:hypothetical protein